MPTRLRKLQINRVDLVDKGANPEADILLFKRAPEPVDGKGGLLVADEIKIPDEITKRLADLESQIGKMADLEKRAGAAEAAVAKAQADLVTAQTQNAELTKALETEKEHRLAAEYRKRAESLRPLGLSIDEAAEMLRKADTAGIGEPLVKSWQAAKSIVEDSDLFKRAGANSHRSDRAEDAWTAIEKAASEMVVKSGGQLNESAAIAKFLDTPEGKRLYNIYESEKGGH